MLKYIKVKNFLSFKNETIIDFISDKYGNKKNNIFSIGKTTLTKNMFIYGANAAGKSNILKCLMIINIVAKKNNLPKGLITPFLLDKKNKEKTSFFEIGFFVDNKEYIYNFEIKNNIILKESLSLLSGREKKVLFTRIGQDIKANKTFEGELNKGIGKIKENSSVLSVLSKWNGKLNNKPINYFFDKLHFIGAEEFPNGITVNYLDLKKNKEKKRFLINFLKLADINIEDIQIKSKPIPIEILSELEKSESIDEESLQKLKNKGFIKINFGHKINGSKELEYFDLENESEGTQRLFSLIGPIVETIIDECTLIVDEIENKLHFLIIKEIIRLINSNIKGKKFQFIFTTHNIDLLDLEILKKDQIAFVEKNKSQSTEFYKLSDFKDIRKELDVKKYYKNGALGAIPDVKDFSILLNSYNEKN